MITALVSALTGLISGTVPDILKEWRMSREHDREMDSLTLQTELQLKISTQDGKNRIAEMDHQLEISAYDAISNIGSSSLKPTGVRWTDAWNSALRPFAVTIIILLFAAIACTYSFYVLREVQSLDDAQTAVELLWGSLVGEAIQAVLGFLFGYRSARK
jgi:hypothetical protein